VASRFPPELRWLRGTLLCLVEVMQPDGTLAVNNERLVEATGLPVRTIGRHLARAVAEGWLLHLTRGGNGRPAAYAAAMPDWSKLSATHG
jgi:hypothetical protein